MSVTIPQTMPRGISRTGSAASSAARGNSSIPRKNQTANGSAARTPIHPNGSQNVPPFEGSGAMFNAKRANSKCGMAPIQKTASTASASNAMNTENRNDASTPTMLIPTNAMYASSHHIGPYAASVPKIVPM